MYDHRIIILINSWYSFVTHKKQTNNNKKTNQLFVHQKTSLMLISPGLYLRHTRRGSSFPLLTQPLHIYINTHQKTYFSHLTKHITFFFLFSSTFIEERHTETMDINAYSYLILLAIPLLPGDQNISGLEPQFSFIFHTAIIGCQKVSF